jgi:hypothetical protein
MALCSSSTASLLLPCHDGKGRQRCPGSIFWKMTGGLFYRHPLHLEGSGQAWVTRCVARLVERKQAQPHQVIRARSLVYIGG